MRLQMKVVLKKLLILMMLGSIVFVSEGCSRKTGCPANEALSKQSSNFKRGKKKESSSLFTKDQEKKLGVRSR